MATHAKPIVWTIAGSDSGGGAGIQADLLSFHDFGVHGCSVVTAVTAQNSFSVGHVAVTSKRGVAAQINALDSDLNADAIKIGLLAGKPVVETVARYLENYPGFVVCDPVTVASSGDRLLSEDALTVMRDQLLPRVSLLTPNRHEAELLIGDKIQSLADVPEAARQICDMGVPSVLITGGHFELSSGQRLDYWTNGDKHVWLAGDHVDTLNTHGTGCTLSSAIAACVAKGYPIYDALVLARAYVTSGLRHACQLGGGPGAVAHMGWPGHLSELPDLRQEPMPRIHSRFASCEGELGLYPVVDSVDWVRKLRDWGVPSVQIRIKDLQGEALKEALAAAVDLCRDSDTRLFINDYWQHAIELGAYGVHLGQEDLDDADVAAIQAAGLRLGISTHSYAEIARAVGLKPSYIALGPIYDTQSKVMAFSAQGLEQLRRWVELLGDDYPLTAIGGIDQQRVPEVLATGVGSCAMISAVTMADDPQAAVQAMLAQHETAARRRA